MAGLPLSLVSLGNEIRNGMLWPVGQVTPGSSDFTSLATLIKAARNGVNDAVSAGVEKPQVMIRMISHCLGVIVADFVRKTSTTDGT